MTSQIDKIVRVFKSVHQHPLPISGTLYHCKNDNEPHNSNLLIETQWSQSNFERGKTVKFTSSLLINNSYVPLHDSLPVDSTSEILKKFTINQNIKAVVREIQESKKKQYLEIWKNHLLWKNFDLTNLEIHGDVYTDYVFGSFEFSPSEDKIVYLAEKKQPKKEPFISVKPSDSNESNEKKEETKGTEFIYRPDWGEQLVGKVQPVIVISDFENETLTVMDNIPENVSPGQVIWAPDGNGIVGVGWNNEPRRLGLMFCSNRPGCIFHLTNDNEYKILSDDGVSVRSPRFSPDGKTLIWQERQSGGPHESCHRLVKYDWILQTKEVLIDIIDDSIKTKNGTDFYGIYILNFPKRCWSKDGKRIVFSTQRRNDIATYVFNLDDRSLIEIEFPIASRNVMDVLDDNVLVSDSSMLYPHTIRLGKLPPLGQENSSWNWIDIITPILPVLDNYRIQYLTLNVDEESPELASTFTAIYLGPAPNKNTKYPLLVWSHGGPHGCSANLFRHDILFYAKLGFALLFVNYRGSTGSGEKSIKSLLGNIGNVDVKDCHQATLEILKLEPSLDPERVSAVGGSHGGFLSLHLSGKYPDIYKAICVRNPVVDVLTMLEISDIPDWSAVECGYAYEEVEETDSGVMDKMKNCSPLKNVLKVKAPTLLLLGKNDLRVQHIPTLTYYHKLRSINVPTKILLYEDNHSLSHLPHEIDSSINIALWLKKYLNIEYK